PYGRASDVSLDAIANLGSRSRVRVERMRWGYGPWGSKLDGLTADLTADSTGVHARLDDLRTEDLEMNARADWRGDDPERDVHVVVGRVRWRWLAKVFDNRSFDVPGEGAFVLDARGSREWHGASRARSTGTDSPRKAPGARTGGPGNCCSTRFRPRPRPASSWVRCAGRARGGTWAAMLGAPTPRTGTRSISTAGPRAT